MSHSISFSTIDRTVTIKMPISEMSLRDKTDLVTAILLECGALEHALRQPHGRDVMKAVFDKLDEKSK